MSGMLSRLSKVVCTCFVVVVPSVLVGCAKYHLVGVPRPIPHRDVCGASRSCGSSGIYQPVRGEVAIVQGKPTGQVGVVDDHSKKAWMFNTPTPCAGVEFSESDFVMTEPVETTVKIEKLTNAKFKAKLKAKLDESVSKFVAGNASAAIDAAVQSTMDIELELAPKLVSVTDQKYLELKSTCQKGELRVRKQIVILKLAGTASRELERRLKTELEGKLKSSEELAAVLPGDGDMDVDAAFTTELKKAVDSVISEHFYLIGASFED